MAETALSILHVRTLCHHVAENGTTSQIVTAPRCSLIKNPAERADLKQLMVSALVYSLRSILLVCNVSRLSFRYTPSSRCLKWSRWTLQDGCAAQLGSISRGPRLMGPQCETCCTRGLVRTYVGIYKSLFSVLRELFPFTRRQFPAKPRGGDTLCKRKGRLANQKPLHNLK